MSMVVVGLLDRKKYVLSVVFVCEELMGNMCSACSAYTMTCNSTSEQQRSLVLVLVQCLVGSVFYVMHESSSFFVCAIARLPHHGVASVFWSSFAVRLIVILSLCHALLHTKPSGASARVAHDMSRTDWQVQRQGRQDVVRWWSHKCITSTSTTTRSMNWINDCRRLRMHERCEGVVVTVSVSPPPTIMDLTP